VIWENLVNGLCLLVENLVMERFVMGCLEDDNYERNKDVDRDANNDRSDTVNSYDYEDKNDDEDGNDAINNYQLHD